MPITKRTAHIRMPRRVTLIATLSALLVGGAAIGVASAAIPDAGTGVIHGCQNKATGIVRVVDPSLSGNLAHCITTNGPLQELAFTFNQTGPAGPAGHAGATGATGATGPKGDQGIQGLRGDPGLPGVNGTNGTNGIDGIDGLPGKDGTNGVDGKDGLDGLPGATGPAGPEGPAGPGSGRTVLMANVGSNGELQNGGDATLASVDAIGIYTITFAQDLTHCAVAVTTLAVVFVEATVAGLHTVAVRLTPSTGTGFTQAVFHLIVAC